MARDDEAAVGWDIGGVNTKAALVSASEHGLVRSVSTPYELQRDPGALVPTLRALAAQLGARPGDPHAVTMTAELSQLFRTKREGVAFVLDALETAFPGARLHVYGVSGSFMTPDEARRRPLEVAASNWVATAALVGIFEPDAILMDIGTTTTDIIPIQGGRLATASRTDLDRLVSGELVYTGALRTPAEALVRDVPVPGGRAAVSAEGFALIGDALVWLGRLRAADYSAATPDGRPPEREFAGERLARLVCADREMLDDTAIDAIARTLAEAQVEKVAEGLVRVRAANPGLRRAVVTGVGDFIAAEAARGEGLDVVALSDRLGDAARTAPAAAVAWLFARATASRAS
jgi:probable H4MPT-linked C1 transfer pathway protein